MIRRHCSPSLSIHAPTRGATIVNVVSFKNCDLSIHAPTRGATRFILHLPHLLVFQSTLLQEERLSVFQIIINCCLFQSTLLQEERLCFIYALFQYLYFQSTLLQEERPAPQIHPPQTLTYFQSTLLQEERLL